MNPVDLPEVEFLALYGAVVLGGLLLAFILRWGLRGPGPSRSPVALNAYEIAYLAGGPIRAVQAALARLLQLNQLSLGASTGRLYREEDLSADAAPLERRLHAVEPGTLVTRAVDWALAETDPIGHRLEELGLVLSPRRSLQVRWVTGLLLVLVALLGGVRIGVEVARQRKPVNVVLLTVLPLAGAILAFVKRPDRSRRGDRVLAQLRVQHGGLDETVRTRWEELSDEDVTLAVAVFGLGALTRGPLSRLRTALTNPPENADESLPLAPPADTE